MTWTIEALYQHVTEITNLILARIDERFVSLERATDLALSNARAERDLAAEQLGVRLESMNEFREAMKDQAAKFVTRKEAWGYLFGLAAAMAAMVGCVLAFHGT
jgi:hypothetical protein